jgi:hypothetical protein
VTPSPSLPNTGYSSRALPEKLGFGSGMAVAFVGLPEALSDLARSADFAEVERARRWTDLAGIEQRYDVVHAFTRLRAEVEGALSALQGAIKPDGMIWVSWPKKSSKVQTDVTENIVRETALRLDLVDVKVAAVDDIWSGLKLVIRKERRK